MKELRQIREEIDAVDAQLSKLIEHRLRLADAVAAAKRASGMVVGDPVREQEILDCVSAQVGPDVAGDVRALYSAMFDVSKHRQRVQLSSQRGPVAHGEYEFRVRSYECGESGEATLVTICNYLQEAASLHAEMLGFSKSDFVAEGANLSWVLTRMCVRMRRYPHWEERVRVETWPSGGRKIAATRDFRLRVGDELIGVATTEWMIIDLATRKIVAVPQRVYDLSDVEGPRALPGHQFAKLRWDCRAMSDEQRFRARRGDIDLNGHVNNVHYVEWLLEALPAGVGPIADFEIAFRSETLAGDEVLAEAAEVEPRLWAAHVAAAGGGDHVVARIGVANGL